MDFYIIGIISTVFQETGAYESSLLPFCGDPVLFLMGLVQVLSFWLPLDLTLHGAQFLKLFPPLPFEPLSRFSLHLRVPSRSLLSMIHNSCKVETTQVFIHGWMRKHNVAYPCNGIFFSLKKEGNSAACYSMDKLWKYANEINQSQKHKYSMILLIWGIVIRFMETWKHGLPSPENMATSLSPTCCLQNTILKMQFRSAPSFQTFPQLQG